MRVRALAVGLGYLLFATAAVPSGTPALYKPVATVALGSPERWDYIVFDGDAERVYIAHRNGVSVVDAKTFKLIGNIPVSGTTHGIGISTATHAGYTDDSEAGVAVPFDPVTLKAGAPIKTALDADGIVLDPASGHLLVLNGDSGSISVIDVHTNKVVATIDGGGGLEFGAADGKGQFFVNGAERNEIVRVSTLKNEVTAHWPLKTCEKPRGIALDRNANRLFVSCANGVLAIVDAANGREIAQFPIGKMNDGAAFDPVHKRILASNGDGTLTVIKERGPNNFVALGTEKTTPSARTIAIDPKNGRVFLAAAKVAKVEPPSAPGRRPKVTFVPGSLKLIVLDPI